MEERIPRNTVYADIYEYLNMVLEEFTLAFFIILAFIVVGTNLLMFYFLIAAIIDSYNKAS